MSLSTPVFRPGLCRQKIMSSLLRLERKQKILQTHFEFAYFYFFLIWNWNDKYVHTLPWVLSKTIPDSRPKWAKSIRFSGQGAKTIPLGQHIPTAVVAHGVLAAIMTERTSLQPLHLSWRSVDKQCVQKWIKCLHQTTLKISEKKRRNNIKKSNLQECFQANTRATNQRVFVMEKLIFF